MLCGCFGPPPASVKNDALSAPEAPTKPSQLQEPAGLTAAEQDQRDVLALPNSVVVQLVPGSKSSLKAPTVVAEETTAPDTGRVTVSAAGSVNHFAIPPPYLPLHVAPILESQPSALSTASSDKEQAETGPQGLQPVRQERSHGLAAPDMSPSAAMLQYPKPPHPTPASPAADFCSSTNGSNSSASQPGNPAARQQPSAPSAGRAPISPPPSAEPVAVVHTVFNLQAQLQAAELTPCPLPVTGTAPQSPRPSPSLTPYPAATPAGASTASSTPPPGPVRVTAADILTGAVSSRGTLQRPSPLAVSPLLPVSSSPSITPSAAAPPPAAPAPAGQGLAAQLAGIMQDAMTPVPAAGQASRSSSTPPSQTSVPAKAAASGTAMERAASASQGLQPGLAQDPASATAAPTPALLPKAAPAHATPPQAAAMPQAMPALTRASPQQRAGEATAVPITPPAHANSGFQDTYQRAQPASCGPHLQRSDSDQPPGASSADRAHLHMGVQQTARPRPAMQGLAHAGAPSASQLAGMTTRPVPKHSNPYGFQPVLLMSPQALAQAQNSPRSAMGSSRRGTAAMYSSSTAVRSTSGRHGLGMGPGVDLGGRAAAAAGQQGQPSQSRGMPAGPRGMGRMAYQLPSTGSCASTRMALSGLMSQRSTASKQGGLAEMDFRPRWR